MRHLMAGSLPLLQREYVLLLALPSRHGSVYKTGGRTASTAPDPYDVVREAIGKTRRQELFSFAAAQLLLMGTPERLALLQRYSSVAGPALILLRGFTCAPETTLKLRPCAPRPPAPAAKTRAPA
jgi:hypothetical protein